MGSLLSTLWKTVILDEAGYQEWRERPNVFLRGDINLLVMPGIEERLEFVQGESMVGGESSDDELDVWLHHTTALDMGIDPGERFEIRDLRRGVTIPIRIAVRISGIAAGRMTWRSTCQRVAPKE